MKLEKISPLTNEYLESIGFVWHTDSDDSSYIADEFQQYLERDKRHDLLKKLVTGHEKRVNIREKGDLFFRRTHKSYYFCLL